MQIIECYQFEERRELTVRKRNNFLSQTYFLLTMSQVFFLLKLDFSVQAEIIAVETSIDVGNILWMFYNCLLV